jgi:hypothetical protein
MFKLLKFLTAALLFTSSVAMADMTFERIKEELWFKGEKAMHERSSHHSLGEMLIVELPYASAEEEMVQVEIPVELEVGLAMWVLQK